MLKYDFYRCSYSLSNGKSPVFIPRDIFAIEWQKSRFYTTWHYPKFSRSKVSKINNSQTVRASAKSTLWLAVCRLLLWTLLSMTLTYIFNVKLFSWLFWHVSAGKHKPYYWRQIGSQTFPIDWCQCECWHVMTYIFNVTHFEMWISRTRWELANNALVWRWYRLIKLFVIERDHCEYCTTWPWLSFSRSNISC